MGPMWKKDRDSIQIVCLCGRDFNVPQTGEGGEFPCPACGRVNILPSDVPSREGEGAGEVDEIGGAEQDGTLACLKHRQGLTGPFLFHQLPFPAAAMLALALIAARASQMGR